MSEFLIRITTKKLVDPLPHCDWVAKANAEKTGSGLASSPYTSLEHWGKTEEEAFDNAYADARKWIQKHLP